MRGRRNLIPVMSLIAALLLAACEFRIHADLVILEDETGTFSVEMSMDEQLAALAGGDFGGELAIGEDLVPEGWTAEVVSGEGYEGIRARTAFESLDQLRDWLGRLAGGAEASPLPALLSDMSPTREDDTFRFRLVVPTEVEGLLGEGLEQSPVPIDLAMLDDVFDIRFALALPGEIVSHNADADTGQALVWNISLGDAGRVLEAESQIPRSGSTMIVLWVLIGLALVVAGYTAVRFLARRRAQENPPDRAVA